jgi:hypothetical protein
MTRTRRRHRGFALGMVLVLLLALSAAVASTFIIYKQSSGVSGHMLRQRQNFYVCDGAARLIARAAQAYAEDATSPNTTDMKAAVCTAGGSPAAACTTTPLPSFVPGNYTVDDFDVEVVGSPTDTVLDSGPYAGTNARVQVVKLSVSAVRNTNLEKCSVEQELALATFPLLKHTVFGQDKLYWVPEKNLDVYGHVHANDDICLAEGSSVAFNVEQVTAGGSIYRHNYPTACGVSRGTHAMGIGNGGSFPGSVYQLRNGSSDSDARDSGWAGYATLHFNGQAEDSSHGIEPLVLPGLSDASVQSGKDASAVAVDNTGSLRFLIDPVRTSDSSAVKQAKLACQSDLRIINGVWYLASTSRPSTDPCGGWPGTPIWSDHPGRFTINAGTETEEGELTGNIAVGQYDIASDESWTSVPERYSYYRYNTLSSGSEGELTYGSTMATPVISYGTLIPSGGSWVPGHWVQSGDAADVCGTTHSSSSTGELVTFDDSAGCGAGAEAGLLNATRSGFLDPEIGGESPNDSSGDRSFRANVLTMNINIGALRAAFKATGGKELGSYFSGSSRDFNGIIWIGATWTDSLTGFGSTSTFAGGSLIWPRQGDTSNANDTNQPGMSSGKQSAATNPALPYPLCGASSGTTPIVAGDDMTTAPSGAAPFKVPACSSYAEAGARPVAIRLFNADTVGDSADTADELNRGLTLVTSLPMYVMGNVNSFSDPSTSTSTPWVPVLLGADHIRLLSESWSDEKAYFNGGANIINNGSASLSGQVARAASDTEYNFSALTGMVPNSSSAWGGGVDASMLLLENWGSASLDWRGSLVIGFSPVYARWAHAHYAREPNWEWRHDPHLDRVSSQPPGAPVFRVSATRAWRR